MEKVFLFEIASKLYIATDTSPVELTNFSICSEMVFFNKHNNYKIHLVLKFLKF